MTRNLPGNTLTYSFNAELKIGDIVKVPLQNKIIYGVVISVSADTPKDFDLSKIKPISEVFPYSLNTQNLRFLSSFSLNTFNSKNLVLDSLLNPLELLIKKDLVLLDEIFRKKQAASSKEPEPINSIAKITIYNEKDVLFRIRYIIRSQSNVVNKDSFRLFVFPERKLLDKIVTSLKTDSEFKKIHIFKYLADKSKFSKETIKEICGINKSSDSEPKIIFSLRAGIFLPIQNLTEINLIDESNSLYIQEQNKIYFDTREAVFLISRAFNTNLNFISSLPSGRLYNFKNLKTLDSSTITSKPLRIQITQRNPRADEFSLFSDFVEQQITSHELETEVFESID
ncbi:MAG: hypothetical protein WCK98_01440 [bacterium]